MRKTSYSIVQMDWEGDLEDFEQVGWSSHFNLDDGTRVYQFHIGTIHGYLHRESGFAAIDGVSGRADKLSPINVVRYEPSQPEREAIKTTILEDEYQDNVLMDDGKFLHIGTELSNPTETVFEMYTNTVEADPEVRYMPMVLHTLAKSH